MIQRNTSTNDVYDLPISCDKLPESNSLELKISLIKFACRAKI